MVKKEVLQGLRGEEQLPQNKGQVKDWLFHLNGFTL